MKHVLIDLETLSTKPDAAIIAIGAVAFDLPGQEILDRFYIKVDLASAMASGGIVDASTIVWWMAQSDEARAEFKGKTILLPHALEQFTLWVEKLGDDFCVWGNGADFDITILGQAYHRISDDPPWSYRNVRCFRTVRNTYPPVKITWEGTAHKAVDDAEWQAGYLMALWDRDGLK
jgi:exodeoxyribonuclease VIII